MRIIDRLHLYLFEKRISAYSFERSCQVANGYLKKQKNGKGSIGSHILERIHSEYPDLNIVWLVSGKGKMNADVEPKTQDNLLEEDQPSYSKIERMDSLAQKIILLEKLLADKEKIIALLEAQVLQNKQK